MSPAYCDNVAPKACDCSQCVLTGPLKWRGMRGPWSRLRSNLQTRVRTEARDSVKLAAAAALVLLVQQWNSYLRMDPQ